MSQQLCQSTSDLRFVDLHCDTISEIRDHPDATHHITVQKLERGSVVLQCFALFTDLAKYEKPEKRALELYGTYLRFLRENQEDIAPVHTWQDFIDLREKQLIGSILTLEEGDITFGGLEFLETWHELGVRMITLTWNHPNRLADRNGLTEYGTAYVRRMEELGIVVDVSHLPDKAFWDVCRIATRPFIASHSNARQLCHVSRNLTDDMIRAVGRHHGVIGLNFYARFLKEGGEDYSTLDDMIRHLRHIMEVGGEDVIALGTDFDGITSGMELKDAGGLHQLARRMLESGFTRQQVDKFSHANAERVFRDILADGTLAGQPGH